jgi:hypothetical protein
MSWSAGGGGVEARQVDLTLPVQQRAAKHAGIKYCSGTESMILTRPKTANRIRSRTSFPHAFARVGYL